MKEDVLHFHAWKLICAFRRNDVVAFHVPNGEKRDRRTAARLQAMGVVPGVADFIIIIAGRVHGVELKTTTGRMSPAQIVFQSDLERAGGLYHVARTLDELAGILNAIGALRVKMDTQRLAGLGAQPPAPGPGNPSPRGAMALA